MNFGEHSLPINVLEHSFSRMTWRASIRQKVDDEFGVWVGLAAKQTK
jgi:hypothetical protein